MNRRYLVAGITLVAISVFVIAYAVIGQKQNTVTVKKDVTKSALIRFHSPVIGPANAPVTIVEFFDPACEACRAFHPVVKDILATYPDKVRVVMRYAAFHDGSDTAVKILESARKQNIFEPVLEALLNAQPYWADHSGAKLGNAWKAAERVGLDVALAQKQILDPEILAVLNQDAADIATIGVKQTPTFFVDGQPLLDFGVEQLKAMVRTQVEATN